MKRLRFLLPMFVLTVVTVMAGPAWASGGGGIPLTSVPEPSSIIVFAGLAAMGFVGWLWQARRRRP